MLYGSSDNLSDDVRKVRRRTIVMRDINRKLKKIKRQVGSFDGSSSGSLSFDMSDDLKNCGNVLNFFLFFPSYNPVFWLKLKASFFWNHLF